MKKILALLLAFVGFGFAACDRDDGDQIVPLYGIRTAEYQEKGTVDATLEAATVAYSEDNQKESVTQ